jgi:DNA modification methylase
MNTIKFLNEDACRLSLEDKSIDLIVTSPPYVGLDPSRYGGDPKKQINTNAEIKKTLKLYIKAIKEMERVIKDSGSIIIEIGHPNNFPYIFVSEILKKTNLKLALPPFIQSFKHVDYFKERNKSERFNTAYTFWFHFAKDPDNIYFNPFFIKKEPFLIWEIDAMKEATDSNKILSQLGNIDDSFNTEIAKRFIEIFSKPGHTVLDPFGGSGITAVCAYLNNRNAITNDISEEQSAIAIKRFEIETKDKK